VDTATGEDKGGWIQPADGSELLPFGRGLLFGDLVVWPLHDKHTERVLAVRHDDGELSDDLTPDRLNRVRPGNMAFASGCLAVVTARTLDVYVDPKLLLKQVGRDRRGRWQ
jgi:hypothetical protein